MTIPLKHIPNIETKHIDQTNIEKIELIRLALRDIEKKIHQSSQGQYMNPEKRAKVLEWNTIDYDAILSDISTKCTSIREQMIQHWVMIRKDTRQQYYDWDIYLKDDKRES